MDVTFGFPFDINIDWATDWSLEEVLSILDSKNVEVTFFATHKTFVINN